MNGGCSLDDTRPCLVPPHPDLHARLQAEPDCVSPPTTSIFAQTRSRPTLSARTGTLRGLNDGTIYPDADFESSASLQHMREAALRRTSLRGAIR